MKMVEKGVVVYQMSGLSYVGVICGCWANMSWAEARNGSNDGSNDDYIKRVRKSRCSFLITDNYSAPYIVLFGEHWFFHKAYSG